MNEDMPHAARMKAGEAAMAWLEALEDDDVIEALEALTGWSLTTQQRLAHYGLSRQAATGSVIGVVMAAMNPNTEPGGGSNADKP